MDLITRDSFMVFGRPSIEEAEIAEVVDSLRSGWIGSGPKVQRFERMLEEYVGAPHVRCVASCSAALTLSLLALDIGPGDEVLVPTMTFVASSNAIEHAGAIPVFVDCEPGTGLMDLAHAEALVTERTRAIMPVHMAGRPVDMDGLAALARRHDLRVVEDAAHALGAEWRGRRIGATESDVTAYSFYVTKNITTIEGGAIATADPGTAERIEQLALHGLSLGAWQRFTEPEFRHYEATAAGYKCNMTDVQAALGIHQLPRLDSWIEARADAWHRYDDLLATLPVETPPIAPPRLRHARHLYQVLIEPGQRTRDDVAARMGEHRIGIGVHYRAVHLHPYFRDRYGLRPEEFPVATDMSQRTLSLPLGPDLTAEDQDDVVQALTLSLGG